MHKEGKKKMLKIMGYCRSTQCQPLGFVLGRRFFALRLIVAFSRFFIPPPEGWRAKAHSAKAAASLGQHPEQAPHNGHSKQNFYKHCLLLPRSLFLFAFFIRPFFFNFCRTVENPKTQGRQHRDGQGVERQIAHSLYPQAVAPTLLKPLST